MTSTRSRSLAAIVAGALLLATLAGCGGDSDKKSDGAKPSSSSPSASLSTPAGEPTGSPGGTEVDATGFITEVADAMRTRKTAHMVIQLGTTMTANADFKYAADGTTQMRMVAQTGGQRFEVIVVGGAMYLQQPGGKYLQVKKSDPGMGSLMQQFSNLGPQASIDAVKAGLKSVKKFGKQKIDGDEVTRYELTVDTEALAEQLGSASPAGMAKTTIYTLFVDEDNLMRRVELEMDGQETVMSVSDWGKPVVIKAPPKSKIVSGL